MAYYDKQEVGTIGRKLALQVERVQSRQHIINIEFTSTDFAHIWPIFQILRESAYPLCGAIAMPDVRT